MREREEGEQRPWGQRWGLRKVGAESGQQLPIRSILSWASVGFI